MTERIVLLLRPKEGAARNEEGEWLFLRHGILIEKGADHWKVIFPQGTIREEVGFHTSWSQRYQLCCPDGFRVDEIFFMDARGDCWSRLSYYPHQ
jgi:hypothetical protein